MSVEADIAISRGSNQAAARWILEGDDGQPLRTAGRQFILFVKWRRTTLRKVADETVGFALKADTATLSWSPSLEESRQIPIGQVARYEIEMREGDLQVKIISGSVTNSEGLDDD